MTAARQGAPVRPLNAGRVVQLPWDCGAAASYCGDRTHTEPAGALAQGMFQYRLFANPQFSDMVRGITMS
jgi:hypothetical protein